MEIPDTATLLKAKEGENVEFKEAKNRYSFDDLVKYCCALANQGGGLMVLGVTNDRPRRIVGSSAFPQPEDTRRSVIDRLHLRIDFAEIRDPHGRVLVFSVPSRPFGMPVKHDGIYWAREADSLVPMAEDTLRAIFAESGHDFSADVCASAAWDDIDVAAVEDFRRRWVAKSRETSLATLSHAQLLRDCEAVVRDGITYAALVLFGTREALGRLLGQAEVIFEYRSTEASGPAQQREEFRQGFFTFYDRLWELINLRNDKQHYQNGLFVLDVPTFEERVAREAILNAVSHRDYQLGGSVFARQYPRRLVIDSPGGLPPDVTLDNILDRQSPRNRRIADIFSRCGLVERSGQGMNLMFELSIKQAKHVPDFRGTDRHHVVLTLDGLVQDPRFLQLMERVGQETLTSFSTQDFLLVNAVHREQPIPAPLRERLPRLLELGVIERAARGRFILGRRYYAAIGKKGTYTRKKGLDRETNKALLLKHIRDNGGEGSKLEDLLQVLPSLSRSQVQNMVRGFQRDHLVHLTGATRGGRWFPVITEARGSADCAELTADTQSGHKQRTEEGA